MSCQSASDHRVMEILGKITSSVSQEAKMKARGSLTLTAVVLAIFACLTAFAQKADNGQLSKKERGRKGDRLLF